MSQNVAGPPKKAVPEGDFDSGKISRLKARIDARLEAHFPSGPGETRLECAIRHGLLSPGKRVRPLITLLACEQSGGSADMAIDAACAVEMVHAASLIMDDLPSMDDAKLRRGCLATHVVFGESAAMLATIALLNEAYRLVAAENGAAPDARLKALEHLAQAVGVEGLAGGQERDLACSKTAPTKVSLKDMEQRHLEKTGALFAAAAAIGGELAGADAATVAHLRRFGSSLGLAFQAFDDVIDVACSEAQTGKDVAQDQDKSTVVSLLGADGATVMAERRLERAIESAEAAALTDTAPLGDLARMIGAQFTSMTR
ncbi:MAG: polyprenyl synthetase family protein [Pseudomonadota bacterium]